MSLRERAGHGRILSIYWLFKSNAPTRLCSLPRLHIWFPKKSVKFVHSPPSPHPPQRSTSSTEDSTLAASRKASTPLVSRFYPRRPFVTRAQYRTIHMHALSSLFRCSCSFNQDGGRQPQHEETALSTSLKEKGFARRPWGMLVVGW